MARKPRGPLLERAKTDASLRTERKNSDQALQSDRAAAASGADVVIDQARTVADAVLSEARLKADQESLVGSPREASAQAGERAAADRAVEGEREAADVTLRDDRAEQATALEALLVHERAATDAYLLTERGRADDAVAHRDDFLGMVAHDVRNLLSLVVLNLELLRPDDAEPPPHVTVAADRIRRCVARMNRLIGDLVDVTSIDAGKLAIAPTEGDAAALVAEVTEAFAPAAREKGITLSAALPPSPLLATFDHHRIFQVFANLIANAIKFTPKGGKVSVGVEPGADALRFHVSDTGLGIPEPMLLSVFERFWQVGDNDKRGLGLGLYISKSIVTAHGGQIWAESRAEAGSQFYFTLPNRSAPPTA